MKAKFEQIVELLKQKGAKPGSEIDTPAPPPFPGQVLSVDVRVDAESISDAAGCRSILSIDYNAYDLTGGDVRVTSVVLKVNGEVWHDSGSISTAHYHHSIESRVDCGEAFTIEVIAANKDGQVATAGAFIVTPQP